MSTFWLVLLLLVVGLIVLGVCCFFWPHIKTFFFGGRGKKRRNKRDKMGMEESEEFSTKRKSKFEFGSTGTSGQDSDMPPPKKKRKACAPVSTGTNKSSQGTSPQETSSKGTTSKGTSSQGTSSKGTTSKGTSSQGTSSKGTTSKGTSSQGTSSKGTTSKGTSSQGTSSKGTTSKGTSSPYIWSPSFPWNPLQTKPSKGTSSKGTTSKGTSSQGQSPQGSSTQGTSSTANSSTHSVRMKANARRSTTEATANPYLNPYYDNRYQPPQPYPNPYLNPNMTYPYQSPYQTPYQSPYQQYPLQYPDRYTTNYPTRPQATSPRPSYNQPQSQRQIYSPALNNQPNIFKKAYKPKNPFKWFKTSKKEKYQVPPEAPEDPISTYVYPNNQPRPQNDGTKKKKGGFMGLFKWKKKSGKIDKMYPMSPENDQMMDQAQPKKKRKWWQLKKKSGKIDKMYPMSPENGQTMDQDQPKKKRKWWKLKKKSPKMNVDTGQENRDTLMTNTKDSPTNKKSPANVTPRPRIKGTYQVGEIPAFRKAQVPEPQTPKKTVRDSQSPRDVQVDEPQTPREVQMPQVQPSPADQIRNQIQMIEDPTPEFSFASHREDPFAEFYQRPYTPPHNPNFRFNCPCPRCLHLTQLLEQNIFTVPLCPKHLLHNVTNGCLECRSFYRKLTTGYALKHIDWPRVENCGNICDIHEKFACRAHSYQMEPNVCETCTDLQTKMNNGVYLCTCFEMCLQCHVLQKNHFHLRKTCCNACLIFNCSVTAIGNEFPCRAHRTHIDPENCLECKEFLNKGGVGDCRDPLLLDDVVIPQRLFQVNPGI